MIVKFFKAQNKAKKYSSGGDGVKDYLLGENYKNDTDPTRKFAKVLRGDVDTVTEIINGLDFSTPYSSGCLSFDGDESERLTDDIKHELMDKFERTLFGDHVDRVASYWVEHTDKIDPNTGKERTELNFVIGNTDLVTGKFMPVYYHGADMKRVDNFKSIANFEYDLSDPNDPKRKISTRIPNNNPANVKDLKSSIDDFIYSGVAAGALNNRDEVAEALTLKGYKILKLKEGSISIKNPDPDSKRNVRLEGAFYEKSFNAEQWLENYKAPVIKPDSAEFDQIKAEKAPLIEQKRTEYEFQMQKRNEFLSKRFPPPKPMPPDFSIIPSLDQEKVKDYANRFNSTLAGVTNLRIAINTAVRESAERKQRIDDINREFAEREQRIDEVSGTITDREARSQLIITRRSENSASVETATRTIESILAPPKPKPMPSLAEIMQLDLVMYHRYIPVGEKWSKTETDNRYKDWTKQADWLKTLRDHKMLEFARPVNIQSSRSLNDHEYNILNNIKQITLEQNSANAIIDIGRMPVDQLRDSYPTLKIHVDSLALDKARLRPEPITEPTAAAEVQQVDQLRLAPAATAKIEKVTPAVSRPKPRF